MLHQQVARYNITVALPPNSISFLEGLSVPEHVREYRTLTRTRGPVMAVMNHLTYAPPTAAFLRGSLLPPPATRYFTILRTPWEAFLSHFCYYKFEKALNAFMPRGVPLLPKVEHKTAEGCDKALRAFVDGFDQHYRRLPALTALGMTNAQSNDLGLPLAERRVTGAQAAAAAAALVARLDRELDLVLLTEYFDESLVLLRRLMCWSLEDMVYLGLKQPFSAPAHTENSGATGSVGARLAARFTAAERENVDVALNSVDRLVYAHYNVTFWRRVAAEGPSFAAEVVELRARLREFAAECGPASAGVVAAIGGELTRCMLARWDSYEYTGWLAQRYFKDTTPPRG